MGTIGDFVGILACGAPIVALVVYMAWATRRPKCEHCNHALPEEGAECHYCGLSPRA